MLLHFVQVCVVLVCVWQLSLGLKCQDGCVISAPTSCCPPEFTPELKKSNCICKATPALQRRQGPPEHTTNATPTLNSSRGGGGGPSVSLPGVILGTCTTVVLGGLAILLVVYVAFRCRRRRTETLEPWPEAVCAERAIHNPTYGAEEYPRSPTSHSPSPTPAYEDVQSPTSIDASDTDSVEERVVNNPLYSDMTYSPTHSPEAPSNNHTQVSIYAYSTAPEYQPESIHNDRNNSSTRTKRISSRNSQTQSRVRFQEPLAESPSEQPGSDELKDSLDYSVLDQTTSYASLEPYMGNPPPPVPKHKSKSKPNTQTGSKVTETDPEDYSHLSR